MVYVFAVLFSFSWFGVFMGAKLRNGPQMFYSFLLAIVWATLTLYWAGKIF